MTMIEIKLPITLFTDFETYQVNKPNNKIISEYIVLLFDDENDRAKFEEYLENEIESTKINVDWNKISFFINRVDFIKSILKLVKK